MTWNIWAHKNPRSKTAMTYPLGAGLNYKIFVEEIYEKFIVACQSIDESQTMCPPRIWRLGPASSAYLSEREIAIAKRASIFVCTFVLT